MIVRVGNWYKLRNNTVVGPIKALADGPNSGIWCPNANFMQWGLAGRYRSTQWKEHDRDIAEEIPAHILPDMERQFAAIKAEFNWLTASIACGMYLANCVKPIEDRHLLKDIIKTGTYTAELLVDFDSLFYSSKVDAPVCFADALLCWQVLYEWQCRCALEGLGGCVKLSLKELINKLDKEERQA